MLEARREAELTPMAAVSQYLGRVRLRGALERWDWVWQTKEIEATLDAPALIAIGVSARPPYADPTHKFVRCEVTIPKSQVQACISAESFDELALRLCELVGALVGQALNFVKCEALWIGGIRPFSQEVVEEGIELAKVAPILGADGRRIA